jgi:hypothetical protein
MRHQLPVAEDQWPATVPALPTGHYRDSSRRADHEMDTIVGELTM